MPDRRRAPVHRPDPAVTGGPGWAARRPFAGGSLLLLAGGWTLGTAQVRISGLTLADGPAGLAAWLLPAALLLSGVGVWAAPRYRFGWAVLGGLAALAALVGLNLGGFVLGTLAGVLGVALTAGWAPDIDPGRRGSGDTPGGAAAAPGRRRSGAGRLRSAAAALLVVVPAGLLAPPASGPALALPCPPGIRPAAPAAGGCTEADIRRTGPVVPLAAPAGQSTVAGQQALLTGAVVDMAGLSYDGVVALPTRAGQVRALQFTMDSSTATDVALRLRGPRGATVVSGGSLTFRGGVRLYATRLAGAMSGVPVEYTPTAPPPRQLTAISLTEPSLDVVAIRSDRLTIPAMAMTQER